MWDKSDVGSCMMDVSLAGRVSRDDESHSAMTHCATGSGAVGSSIQSTAWKLYTAPMGLTSWPLVPLEEYPDLGYGIDELG